MQHEDLISLISSGYEENVRTNSDLKFVNVRLRKEQNRK